MGDSVLRRTCFYKLDTDPATNEKTVRPYEWAQVHVDGWGIMIEPVFPFEPPITAPIDNIDYTNDMQKVNDFVCTDDEGVLKALNSGDTVHPWLHGGTHYPRKGR